MKKIMKMVLVAALSLTLAFCAFACGNTEGGGMNNGNGTEQGDNTGGKPEKPEIKGQSLLSDKTFSQGLGVKGLVASGADAEIGRYFDYGGTVENPEETCKWVLGQWSGKSDLRKAKETKLSDGGYNYRDGGKSVTFNPESGVFNLSIDGASEYDHPRKNGEGWAHSLIEQTFELKRLEDAEHLYFKLRFTLDYVENLMSRDEYDSGLHAAQLLWYVTFRNDPKENSMDAEGNWVNGKTGDWFWFGLPIYDNRYDTIQASAAYDQGTNAYISGLSNGYYLPTPLETGVDDDGMPWTYEFTYDALPKVKEAIEEAQKLGALKNVKAENLTINYMNFGWEVPGTFNVSATVEEIDIIYVAKNK